MAQVLHGMYPMVINSKSGSNGPWRLPISGAELLLGQLTKTRLMAGWIGF